MARRFETIEDIAWRGLRLRLWCFGCARSRDVDATKVLQLFIDRGWDIDLAAAQLRFPCRRCRSATAVLIVPASPPAPAAAPEADEPPALSWKAEVARFFHENRRAAKQKPLPPAMALLLERHAQKKGPGIGPGPSRRRIEDLD